jgi:hypothetical protein
MGVGTVPSVQISNANLDAEQVQRVQWCRVALNHLASAQPGSPVGLGNFVASPSVENAGTGGDSRFPGPAHLCR